VTEQALAAHDAALATADERRRAAEDAELRRLVMMLEVAAVTLGMANERSQLLKFSAAMNADRAELLAYIETIRK
jgi:hypothetical protein